MRIVNSRLFYILVIVGIALITVAIILIGSNPSTGYKVSIYAATSPLVWVFLVAGIIIGMYVIIHQIFSEECRVCLWTGFFLIAFSNAVILLLPFLRGYVIYGRWDILTHVGYVVDILSSGLINQRDIYPISHIFLAEFSYALDAKPMKIIGYVIVIYVSFFILYTYILAKVTLRDQQKTVLATLSSTILFLTYTNYQVLPNTLSILYVPFVLAIYIRYLERKTVELGFLLILLATLYPFFHPLTSLVLIFAFVLMSATKVVYEGFCRAETITFKKISINISLISFIIFIMWLSNHYYFWDNNLVQVIRWFRGEATTPMSKQILSVFEKLNLQTHDIIELYIKMYGHISVFLIFSTIATIHIIKKALIKDLSVKNIFILLSWFVLVFPLLMINLFKTIIYFGIWRLIGILGVVLPIFAGFGVHETFKRTSNKISILSVLSILIFSSVIGIFCTYPSPWVLQANQQVTHTEVVGMKWHYGHKDQGVVDYSIRSNFRFADALFGVKTREEREDILPVERSSTSMFKLPRGLVPPHFGYTYYKNAFHAFGEEVYIPISEYDRVFYEEIYPQLGEFIKCDFEKLNCDFTTSKLYTNGCMDIWKISLYEDYI